MHVLRAAALLVLSLIGTACAGDDLPPLPIRADDQRCMAGLDAFPALLSETGCYEDIRLQHVQADLLRYEVNAPLWTEGVDKARYLSLPPGTKIRVEDDAFVFPERSVLVKDFYLDETRSEDGKKHMIETRLMWLRDGEWRFRTYRWNDDGKDAVGLDTQESVQISYVDGPEKRSFEYLIPGEASCTSCHSQASRRVLGVQPIQIRGASVFGREQSSVWKALDYLATDVSLSNIRLVDPYDEDANLSARARSYLHVNCSHCHQPGGFVPAALSFDFRFDSEEPNYCDTPRMYYGDNLGSSILSAGSSEDSALYNRLLADKALQMPPVGAANRDEFGAKLMKQWIESLSACSNHF